MSEFDALRVRLWPLTSNHYRLRKGDSDNIVTACRIIFAEAIKAAEKLPADQPLVLLIGELHESPQYSAVIAGVLSLFAAWRDEGQANDPDRTVIFCDEFSLNWTPSKGFDGAAEHATDLRYSFFDYDPSRRLAALKVATLPNTSHSFTLPIEMALHAQIPYFPVDIHSDRREHLIMADDIVADISHLKGWMDPVPQTPLDARSPEGIALRNRVIYNKIIRAQEQSKARIIVVRCGLYHMFGIESVHSYPQSLCGLHRDSARSSVAPFALLPALVGNPIVNEAILNWPQVLPKGSLENHRDTVVIDNIPMRSYEAFGGFYPPDAIDYIQHAEAHAISRVFSRAVSKNLMPYNPIEVVSPINAPERAAGYRTEARALEEWILQTL